MKTRLSRPRDVNQLAHLIGQIAMGEVSDEQDDGKKATAVYAGQVAGKVGGKARKASLKPERRSEIARQAAGKRWGLSLEKANLV